METKEAIRNEFLREYMKKNYSRMTIKDLCAMTPVARTTFYAHYQNIDEVLEEIEDDLIAGLKEVAARVSRGDMPEMDFHSFMQETILYIKEHWDGFRALLVTQPDTRFEEKLKAAVKDHFRMRYPEKILCVNYGLIAEIMASSILAGYRYWISNPDQMKEDNLIRVTTQALDAIVRILG